MPRRQLWQPWLHSKHRTGIQPCAQPVFASCPAPTSLLPSQTLCALMSFTAKRKEVAPTFLLLGDAVHNWCPLHLNLKCMCWCVKVLGPWSHTRESSLAEVGTGFGLETRERNGTRAAMASFTPRPCKHWCCLPEVPRT